MATPILAPFLTRFGRPLTVDVDPLERSYDQDQQEGLVYQSGRWRAALDMDVQDLASTKVTKVSKETTDDE